MIRWSEIFGAWLFMFTVPGMPISNLICESYAEAWFFRTYEEDMDAAFLNEYLSNV